jgi:hypothetical protein
MKLLLVIAAAAVAAGSFYADYKWRQWMAARRQPPRQHR